MWLARAGIHILYGKEVLQRQLSFVIPRAKQLYAVILCVSKSLSVRDRINIEGNKKQQQQQQQLWYHSTANRQAANVGNTIIFDKNYLSPCFVMSHLR
jgi:hypothetical protein